MRQYCKNKSSLSNLQLLLPIGTIRVHLFDPNLDFWLKLFVLSIATTMEGIATCRLQTMKYNHVTALSVLTAFLQVACITLPSLTHGLEIIDNSNSGSEYETDRVELLLKQDLSGVQTQLIASRLLEEDTSCSNSCDSNQMNRFRASFDEINVVEEEGDVEGHVGFLGRLFDRFTSFVGRWTNDFFQQLWNRHQQRQRQYMIPTETIVPLLSKSSGTIQSLVDMLRQLSEDDNDNDASSSELVQMLYDRSAENMESVITVLDVIITDMAQREKIDFRTLACEMTNITTLLSDVILPNIESVVQVISIHSNNSDMVDRFNEYTAKKKSTTTTTATTAFSTTDDTCLVYGAASLTNITTTARLFDSMDTSSTSTRQQSSNLLGDALIALLIRIVIFIPLSIVISLVVLVIAIILFPGLAILFAIDTSAINWPAIFPYFFFFIFLPIINLKRIVEDIVEIFKILFGPPIVPITREPTVSPSVQPTGSRAPTTASLEESFCTDDIQSQLSVVLTTSPLKSITAMFQNENTFRGIGSRISDRDDMECELAEFLCQTNALMDAVNVCLTNYETVD